MKKNKIINVILSGGSGTRLWPLSRGNKPKQFLQFFEEMSLFQHTVRRNKSLVDDFLLVTNSSQLEHAEDQIREGNSKIVKRIIEPVGRNTAPAITLAALNLDDDDIMIVTPSDHMIGDMNLYQESMKRAIKLASEGFLVTFGIKPTAPNTGFGYIEYNKENVLSFREKPDLISATSFLTKGNFSWNSGMFCFKASVFLEELKKYNELIYDRCKEASKSISKKGEINRDLMLAIPSDSIDYAVLEKSDKIKTVSSSFYWTDLGTFDAIIDYFEAGNKVTNLKRVGNKSYSFSNKEIFSNAENLIIVDTENVIVVLEKGKTDKIKQIYNKVKEVSPILM